MSDRKFTVLIDGKELCCVGNSETLTAIKNMLLQGDNVMYFALKAENGADIVLPIGSVQRAIFVFPKE